MKKTFSILALLIVCISSAIAGEINYFTGTWAEIKAKAKAENKYIFMDCYTDWCGWCKVMDKQTMPDPGVLAIVGDKYIAVKIDMEKGEGIMLAMKYHVSGFPTFMFFNANGDYVYESVGYQEAPGFIKTLNNALDKSKQMTTSGYSASLDIDYPQMYQNAFAGNGKRKFPKPEEVTAYLDKQKDLYSETSWAVISHFELNDKYTKMYLANISKYAALYGTIGTEDKVTSIVYADLQKAIKAKDSNKLNTTLKMVDKYITDDPAAQKDNMRMTFYKETKNWPKYTASVNAMIKVQGYGNAEGINSICWGMYEKCDNKPALKQAAAWMKEVVTADPKYAYMDTYAAVLYKAGMKKDAEDMAHKAIETGKAANEDTKSTEDLLAKMKGSK